MHTGMINFMHTITESPVAGDLRIRSCIECSLACGKGSR